MRAFIVNSKISLNSYAIICLIVPALIGTSPNLIRNWFKMWQLYGSIGKISYKHANTSFYTPNSGLMNGASFSAKLIVSSIAT